MYVAPGLLYLHLPRTGGTFVTNVLERGGSGSRNLHGLGVHDGVRKISEDISTDRLVFGTIRDPWSWYVSFYSSYKHHKTGVLTGPLAELCGNQAPFKPALLAMTRPSGQGLMTSPKLPGHPSGIPRLGKVLKDAQIGLWSWYLISMFCRDEVEQMAGLGSELPGAELPWSVDVLVDLATIEDSLEKVLSAWSGPKSEDTIRFLRTAPPVNESAPQWSWKGVRPSGKPDPRWWEPDMIEAVLDVDGPLLERFGYQSPVGGREGVFVLR